MGSENELGLPPELRTRFQQLEQKLHRAETTAWICGGLAGLIGSYLLLFLSDRLWDTPILFRIVLAIAGWAILASSTAWWVWRWILKRRNLKDLSVIVQHRFRVLGDRLLGIVELSDESRRPPGFSVALYQAAIRQVATDANRFDFREAVRTRPAQWRAAVCASIAVLILLALVIVPAAGKNAFLRWAAPMASIPRFTLVQVRGIPTKKIVPHGEAFDVAGSVEYRSFWKPNQAKGAIQPQPQVLAPVVEGSVHLSMPGQISPGVLRVKLGDSRTDVEIAPTHRPSLRQMTSQIELPQYLDYPMQQANLQAGTLTVLEGSKVSFRGLASRTLKSAMMKVGDATRELNIEKDSFASEPVLLDGAFESILTWVDDLGLAGASPWHVSIETRQDSAPVPDLTDLSREIFVLETDVLPLRVNAKDDFGVKQVGVKWSIPATAGQTNVTTFPSVEALAGSSREKDFESIFSFSPSLLGLPTDSTVEMRAVATDFKPGRQPVESSLYLVHVMGLATHLEQLKDGWEALLSQIEEVSRTEEAIVSALEELRDMPTNQITSAAATEQIAALEREQARNAQQLQRLAQQGMQLMRDAARNPTFDEQTLEDWADTVQQMQEVAENQMQQAQQSMQAASSSQQASPREQQLAEAEQQAQEAQEALEELQQDANRGMDSVQASTLAQRLRKIATEEKRIARRLTQQVPNTIGLPPEELPQRYKDSNQRLASDQTATQPQAETIGGELNRFAERTGRTEYATVSKEMKEANTPDELVRIAKLVSANVSIRAIQDLGEMAKKLSAWADRLEPRQQGQQQQGGGGGGGEQDPRLMEELLALLRMRDSEANLRERTRMTGATPQAQQPTATDPLFRNQHELAKGMVGIQFMNIVPELSETLMDAYQAMDTSRLRLGAARTDESAVAAQTDAVNSLSDAINLLNEQAAAAPPPPGGGRGQRGQQAAQFLMRMMGAGRGRGQGRGGPGGSDQTGTTDIVPPSAGQAGQGDASSARRVNQATGAARELPVEFREALDSYFKGLEGDK